MQKRGLSTVVTTLIVILLVLVAIAVIWIVIRGVIESGTEQIGIGQFTIDMKITQAYIDSGAGGLIVSVQRNPGKGDLTGIRFIVENDGGQTEIIKADETTHASNFPFNELETKTFDIPTSLTGTITKVSIAPIILTESGKEKDLDIIDTKLVKQISTGDCGDGTQDLGEICDDGNTITETQTCANDILESGVHCNSDCSATVTLTEQCDDGNIIDDDGCSSSCTTESCSGSGVGFCDVFNGDDLSCKIMCGCSYDTGTGICSGVPDCTLCGDQADCEAVTTEIGGSCSWA
ncbi:hypothetical protein J4225_02650 [Candidatus Pacearchaeota archaeon]|nr:hypothetical protein [Candidatus Pacearchaeota archaeon]